MKRMPNSPRGLRVIPLHRLKKKRLDLPEPVRISSLGDQEGGSGVPSPVRPHAEDDLTDTLNNYGSENDNSSDEEAKVRLARSKVWQRSERNSFSDGQEGGSGVRSPLSPLADDDNIITIEDIKKSYGSESDDSSDEEMEIHLTISKADKIFFEAEEDPVPGIARTLPTYQWPPIAVPTPVVNTPTPSHHTPTPSHHTPTPSTPISTQHTPTQSISTLRTPTTVTSQLFEPTSKWTFHWQQIPFPPVAPSLRREPFTGQSGPVDSYPTPYDAFTAIWDREIMNHIVLQTNRYAEQYATVMCNTGSLRPNSRISKWRDTNVDELYTFMAIILATGVVVKTKLDEYWNKEEDIFTTAGFRSAMTIDRFKLLLKCVHFNDNAQVDPDSMTRTEAKLYKIEPIVTHLNHKFQQLYNLGQNIALDESLTQWKGQLAINQFIRNKAATIGVKTYEVCDSKNGYLWRFKIYCGKDTAAPDSATTPISGAIPSLVLELLQGLEGQGRTVWMDNYYNSPALSRELKSRGFDCVGTIRTNRQLVPTYLANLTKEDMKPGQFVGCTSGDVDLLVWRDKNRVAMTSTYHGLAVLDATGKRLPTVVQDYNVCMGGIDRKDQMLAMYPIERKRTKVWYKKFFKRLLNVSVLNAFIIYTHKNLTHRDFRKKLTRQLLLQHGPPTQPRALKGTGYHFPAQYPFVNSVAEKPGKLRRQCRVCKKKTSIYCEGCNVTLCPFKCFKKHHQTPNFAGRLSNS